MDRYHYISTTPEINLFVSRIDVNFSIELHVLLSTMIKLALDVQAPEIQPVIQSTRIKVLCPDGVSALRAAHLLCGFVSMPGSFALLVYSLQCADADEMNAKNTLSIVRDMLRMPVRTRQDTFYKNVANALLTDQSIVIGAAGTGSGKTLVGIATILDALANNNNSVLIVVPTLAVGVQWANQWQTLRNVMSHLPALTGVWGKRQYQQSKLTNINDAPDINNLGGFENTRFANKATMTQSAFVADVEIDIDTQDESTQLQAAQLKNASSNKLVLTSQAMLSQVVNLQRWQLIIVDEVHLLPDVINYAGYATIEVIQGGDWISHQINFLWQSLHRYSGSTWCKYPDGFSSLQRWASHQWDDVTERVMFFRIAFGDGAMIRAIENTDQVRLLQVRVNNKSFSMNDIWQSTQHALLLSGSIEMSRSGSIDENFPFAWCEIPAGRGIFVRDPDIDYLARNTQIHYKDCGQPTQGQKSWLEKATKQIRLIADQAKGGVLVLCTSYNDLQRFTDLIEPLDGRLIVQTVDDVPMALLTTFQNINHPVLLATGVFWSGIDFGTQQNMITDLVIPRLPFDPSWVDDDVVGGFRRSDVLTNWRLQQGIGRAARGVEYVDVRKIWILDSRLPKHTLKLSLNVEIT